MKAYQQANRVIVFIDESGFAHDMPRKYGYALREERCLGIQDWHAKGRINVIGALVDSHLLTISLFSDSINANTFYAWIAQDLLPKLPPHRVIVMDNATFHKRADSRQLLEESGHKIEYLPTYSPNLNPIERKWAQSKAIRKQKHGSVDELFTLYVS